MKSLFAAFVFVLFLAFGAAAADVTVNVFSQAWIKGERAKLGEVGMVTGSSAPLVESIREVSLIRVPDAGKPAVINRDFITLRIQQSGVDPSRVEIIAPPKVSIFREARATNPGDIKSEVERYVKEQLGARAEKAKIEVSGIDGEVMLPPGRVTVEIGADTAPRYWGYARIPVLLKVNDQPHKKVWAKVSVSYPDDVVVVKGPVKRGEVITEEMVAVEERDTLKMQHPVFRGVAEVVGKKAVRNVKAGEVLTNKMLDLPVALKRGDRISVVAQNGAFRVSIQAEAMENGSVGDVIRVKNVDSRKIISAEILDELTAKVIF